MNRKKLITFIALAYGISWLIWLPNLLAAHANVPWGHLNWLHVAGGLGPFLSALITTLIFEKWDGVKAYFKSKRFSLPKLKWLLTGIGMPLGFFLIAALILRMISGSWVKLAELGLNSKLPLTQPLLIWLVWCGFYGLGEEGGWRGLLYPEMVKQYSARSATLYTAAVWAPWHLPLFFYDKDFSTMGLFGTVGWLVGIVFGAFLLGWLLKQAQFNLWPVILWHGTFNFITTSDRINPLFPALMSAMLIGLVLWLARQYDENFEPLRKSKSTSLIK
jgi:uncharacterized protein